MLVDVKFLNEIAMDLPIIRPIKEFIHLNLLLPYQHLPFWEALKEVSQKLEANPFSSLDYYRERIKEGDIPLNLLKEKLNSEESLRFILEGKYEFVHHDSRFGKLHDLWNEHLGINVMELSDGMLIKWLSMYLDQGIGQWQMPGAESESFYQCIRDLLTSSYIKPDPFKRISFNTLFPATPEEAIDNHLSYLCPNAKYHQDYARESIMTLRGWAGLIYNIQQSPQLLPFKRKISLIDFLAVKLVLERAWIEKEKIDDSLPSFNGLLHEEKPIFDDKTFFIFKSLQESLEEATYQKLLNDVRKVEPGPHPEISFQALFCMDDRESPLRRHLENCSNRIETYGTAGHFGIECLYQHPEDAFAKKHCPAPVPAKVFLKDIYKEKKTRKKNTKKAPFDEVQPTGNLLHDWFFSHLSGFSSTLKLTRNLFFPLAFESLENVTVIEPETEIQLLKDHSQNLSEMGVPLGYTHEEMASVIYQQLLLIGFIHHFAPLIFIIGHGSRSENNPYFATYGCGACSGRNGSVNSRAFVGMANDPEVRKIIQEKHHLTIPDSTHFVAGFHDTTRDTVELYEYRKVPMEHLKRFNDFKKYLSLALYKNARERTKSFKLVTYQPISKIAQKEVLRRSRSLYETRPEMGHTNVAYAIVGVRENTKGVIPNHPSFFQSYDPKIDPDGKLLATTLGALIPVCSGINLDYYFSRVDNLRFGAGSKLPQNIVGNFGVSHGTESDLLFGLPFQMIDQHRALRLFVLVEQTPEVALMAIQGNPLVKQIVYNNWIHYACYNNETKKIHVFKEGKWEDYL